MPKLWTSFSLKVRNDVKKGKVDHVSFAKAWLSRARPYPLNVSLSVHKRNEGLSRIVDVIIPNADCLQDIQLCLPFPYLQPLVDVAAGSMALLENVSLSVVRTDYNPEAALFGRKITAFATAPRLHSVDLRYINLRGSKIQFPWSQLTKLHIGEGSNAADTCRDAFLQCTNLIDCTLIMDTWEEEVMPAVPIVVLPYLKRLDITFNGPAHPSPFFQPLNLPALKDLTVVTNDCFAWSHQIFMEFTLRSSLDLERLCFDRVGILPEEFLQFLPHMQSLVELKIELSQFVDDSLFDALCYRQTDAQHLAPKLQILNIATAGDGIDDNGIANMIESRWWTDDAPRTVSRFEEVMVCFDDREIDAGVRGRLEHCRREGLILTLNKTRLMRSIAHLIGTLPLW